MTLGTPLVRFSWWRVGWWPPPEKRIHDSRKPAKWISGFRLLPYLDLGIFYFVKFSGRPKLTEID